MLKSVVFLVAIGAATAVHAQTPPPSAGSAQAWVPPSGPVIDMAGVRAPLDRSYDASAARDGAKSRTAIDYRLSRDGLFGQVGYFCRSDASPIASEEAAVHMDAKDDRLLGGTLRFPF